MNVTIIYETAPDGFRAKQFSDQLAARLTDGHDPNLNLWNFWVLGIPEIRNISASMAATADVVIFSMSEMRTLDGQVKDWIKMWPCLDEYGRPFVVALHSETVSADAPIYAELCRAVKYKGLDFLSSTCRGAETFLCDEEFYKRASRETEEGPQRKRHYEPAGHAVK